MKHLIIVGARGWGREVYATAISLDGYKKDFDIKDLTLQKEEVEGLVDSKIDKSFETYNVIEKQEPLKKLIKFDTTGTE